MGLYQITHTLGLLWRRLLLLAHRVQETALTAGQLPRQHPRTPPLELVLPMAT